MEDIGIGMNTTSDFLPNTYECELVINLHEVLYLVLL